MILKYGKDVKEEKAEKAPDTIKENMKWSFIMDVTKIVYNKGKKGYEVFNAYRRVSNVYVGGRPDDVDPENTGYDFIKDDDYDKMYLLNNEYDTKDILH